MASMCHQGAYVIPYLSNLNRVLKPLSQNLGSSDHLYLFAEAKLVFLSFLFSQRKLVYVKLSK